jgi:hypothetical protein
LEAAIFLSSVSSSQVLDACVNRAISSWCINSACRAATFGSGGILLMRKEVLEGDVADGC